MSRRNAAPKRLILPDPVYGSETIAKFINCIMVDGKKSKAEKIVYTALEVALDKLKKAKFNAKDDEGSEGESGRGSIQLKTPADVLELAISSVRPAVEVRPRRVGGSTYQVPVEVDNKRGLALAMRWIITSSRKRSEKSMINQLSSEMADACQGRGVAFKKKIDTHKMADANKAFAHFRW